MVFEPTAEAGVAVVAVLSAGKIALESIKQQRRTTEALNALTITLAEVKEVIRSCPKR